jgi:hypothetical protein
VRPGLEVGTGAGMEEIKRALGAKSRPAESPFHDRVPGTVHDCITVGYALTSFVGQHPTLILLASHWALVVITRAR